MTQKIYIKVGEDKKTFPIGRRGENNAREVVFDITYFKETFGDGTASLLVLRPDDEVAYPVTVTQSTNEVNWIVTSTDTERSGEGKIELQWSKNNVKVKSSTWGIIIEKDIGNSTVTPPDTPESWAERLIAVEDAVAHLDPEAIVAETLRAEAAENDLANDILAEENRATTAESALSNNIAAETTRAQGVEGTLSNLTTTVKDNLVAAVNELDAGKVSKAGDMMTGSLAIKDANLDATATHTGNYWGTSYQFNITDQNGVDIGHIRPFCTSADLQGLYIETPRTVNGSTVNNYLRLAVDGSGNRKVLLSVSPWLEALGLESVAGDSGWQTLTLNSAFELYTSGFPVRYRKIGKTVEVYGVVKPASEIAAGGTATIGTLPSGYRPPNQLTFLCQGSGLNKWLLTVGSDGNLGFGRYGASSNVAAGTNVWLPFNATFFVD